jgi:methyl-accepting chemotaxis protein
MKISLKIKLMVTFFVLITLPMSVLGYISYTMSANSIQSDEKEQLKQQTSDTSVLIGKTIESVEHSIEVASLNPDITNAAKKSSAADIDTAFEYIKEVQKTNQDSMEVLIITDANGKVVVDSQTKEPNIDLGDRSYMKTTFSTGQKAISEVLTSRFTGNPAIFISYPVKDGGKIIGTLVGSIAFSSISNYASRIQTGDNGYTYMIDKDGLFVYHSDSSKILKENVSDSATDSFKPIIDSMKQFKTSDGFYGNGKDLKYVVYEPVGTWILATTANYDNYMKPALVIRNYTIIIMLISIIIAMVCAYLFSTKVIINPITKLEKLMKRAGEGDLTVSIDIKSNDEIRELGNAFNDMIKHQDEIVKNVDSASEQLSAASEELAASSEEISATIEEIDATINQVAQDAAKQNVSILDVSEVLVQLSSLVQLAQSRAKATSSNAADTMNVADLGRQKVEETVKAINVISIGSDETAKALEILNGLSAKVGGIVNTINSIAEQTSLLALNASIEAARAGEHGKGFSVVAEEVRKLSEESDSKAKEISALVNEMVAQTQNAVITMQRSKSEVENGVIIVSETDKAFVHIINAIENITKHVNEILDITGDEVASSDKVVKLINDIATITESNSSNSENVSSAVDEQAKAMESLTATAEETSSMAEELTRLVEKFKV